MNLSLYTIKRKLIVSFALIFVVTCGLILVSTYFANKEETLGKVLATIADIDRNMHIISKLEKDFFSDDAINPNYYETGTSEYLEKRDDAIEVIKRDIIKLKKYKEVEVFDLQVDIDSLLIDFELYNNQFIQLVQLIRMRGYENFGLEGAMREQAHLLENSDKAIDKVLLLTIRRHEKDFLLRKESKYIQMNLETIEKLRNYIIDKKLDKLDETKVLLSIDNYKNNFTQLVAVDEKIGFNNKQGYKKLLKNTSDKILKRINNINTITFDRAEQLYSKIHLSSIFVIFSYMTFFAITTTMITQYLGKPINSLSDSINLVIKNNFSREYQIIHIESKDEVSRLAKDFQYMLSQVHKGFEEVKDKSEKIEEKQLLLFDSLRYAQQIQYAILPEHELLKQHFADYFLLYVPKDIVSGDFYWLLERHGKVFLAVVDCTGHGVPGAFMSMIGNSLLYQTIAHNQIYEPIAILETLHQEIKDALQQESGKNSDGMDLSLCIFSQKDGDDKQYIEFSGAKGRLLYTEAGELKELKSAKRSIGGTNIKHENKPFELVEFSLNKGEMLYLLTDGFADQLSPTGNKYGNAHLKEFLTTQIGLPLYIQKENLWTDFELHKQDESQRDDITVLAIQL